MFNDPVTIEIIKAIAEYGAMPVIIVLGFKYVWNGTSKKISKIGDNLKTGLGEIRDEIKELRRDFVETNERVVKLESWKDFMER